MPFSNSGVKFKGNDGSIKLIEAPGTAAAVAHVAEFVATMSRAEVDMSELGADFSDGETGQATWEVTAKIWKGKAGGLLQAGMFDCEFVYEDNTTDGKIAGRFMLLSVGIPKRLNQGTAYECRFKSAGTITVTEAIA